MTRPTVAELRALINEQLPSAIIQLAIPLETDPGRVCVEPEQEPPPSDSVAWHSSDFASVNWFGRPYSFTRPQAEVIAALWQAWKEDCPFLSQHTLLNVADSESMRLRDCFKGHPAWGTLIRHGPTCGGALGTYRLMPPE